MTDRHNPEKVALVKNTNTGAESGVREEHQTPAENTGALKTNINL
ncbi:hypothetical protein [Chryseosolibacter histidini]|nr:hypothetical protein [Chryseosolibacter histidini]